MISRLFYDGFLMYWNQNGLAEYLLWYAVAIP